MNTVLPVSIPRWQWRTFDDDLSWLSRRLSAPHGGPIRRVEETHLVCTHSLHHAWLLGDTLELRWRKEVDALGCELWDTILRTSLPFTAAGVSRLYDAWGLAPPSPMGTYTDVPAFLAAVTASTPSVQTVRVERQCRGEFLHGVACSIETIEAGPSVRLQSFSIEHEDPSLIAQVLRDLGLETRGNTNFLQGLKHALGLPTTDPGNRTWLRKSSASTL